MASVKLLNPAPTSATRSIIIKRSRSERESRSSVSDQIKTGQWLSNQNEEILDRLLPQSTPARPLEAVAVGGVGEGAFHQVLAPFAISEPGHRVGLFFSCIQERLLPVATDGATSLRARAKRSKLAKQASAFFCDVLPG
jgi:hypothetical protein